MIEPLRVETGGETILSSRLRALHRYWNEKRGKRSMPSRSEIDPIEIPRLLPIVLIAEITPAGARMRLLGSETTSAYGRELRGQPIGEIEFGEFTQFWRDAFALVLQSATPALASGRFRTSAGTYSIEIALMPLAREDKTLSHIFGGMVIKPVTHEGAIRSNGTPSYVVRVGDDLGFWRAKVRSV